MPDTLPHRIPTDAVIIGAGPVGLFQVFQLGLQDIQAHLIDALPYPGGQCIELYADKPIYDIPGLPRCTGRELTDRLLEQIAPFAPPMHLGQQVQALEKQADGRWLLATTQGLQLLAKTVFIAAGVGAFVPRKVALPALEAFEGRQVFYHHPPPAGAGQAVVMGGEDEALETALALLDTPGHTQVTLLHRSDKLKAEPALLQRFQQAVAQGRLQWVVGQPTGLRTTTPASGPERLQALELSTFSGDTLTLPVDVLLPRLGLSPKLGPLAAWGLSMDRKLLAVDTERFATSEPGIFAVGDINTYPGKRKLILCGFHEATLAAFAAASLIRPEQRPLLQYTTTSPRLHELLGVKPPLAD